MNTAEILQKDPQKITSDFSCQQPDFSGFKEGIWIPLLRKRLASWKLYVRIYGKYLEEFLEDHSPASLSGEDFHAFARRLKKKGLSSGAYNRVLSVLKHFLKSAYEHGFIDTDFSRGLAAYFVKAESKRDTCLDAAKIKLLFKKLASSDSRIARAIELLILTGASKSEILSARWEDYDHVSHLLTVKSRNGSKKTLRLGPQSVAILEGLQGTCQSPWVFPGRDKAKHQNDVFFFWNAIRKDCGLDHIRIQDLRHNYKNWQKNNGYSISIEEQLAPEAKRREELTPYTSLIIQPEVALIGLACAKYENGAGSGISHEAALDTENALLINYLGNILKAGMEAVNCHKGKKSVPTGEKFLTDLAKSALKNAGLSRRDLVVSRSAVYLGLENPEEYSLLAYQQGLTQGTNGLCRNLAQSLTLALGFSCSGTEINSPGSSFLSALQAASLKIAFGDLDMGLVGGTGVYNGFFIQELIPDLAKENYTKMAVLCSPAYAEKARIPVLSIIPLAALNDACAIPRKDPAISEIL